MIGIFCRDRHAGHGLCHACTALNAYARARLERCVYGPAKPTCVNCPIHCYRPELREAIREVMRYAGPRMLARHPILAITHVLDGRRSAPQRRSRVRAGPVPG